MTGSRPWSLLAQHDRGSNQDDNVADTGRDNTNHLHYAHERSGPFYAHHISHARSNAHSHAHRHLKQLSHEHAHTNDDDEAGHSGIHHGERRDQLTDNSDDEENASNLRRAVERTDTSEERTIILEQRQDDGASLVTQVVQTVSIFQIVDQNGSPVETQTVYATPTTVFLDPSSGVTVAVSAEGLSATVAADSPADDDDPAASASAPPAAAPAPQLTTLSPLPSVSMMAPPLSAPLADSSSSSIRLSTAPAHPTVGGAHNSTSPYPIVNGSSASAGNGSVYHGFAFTPSTSLPISTTAFSSSTAPETSWLSSSTFDASASTFTSDSWSTDGFGADTATAQPTTTPSSKPDSSDATDLSPQEKQVIGGVVGSVAGVALVAVFLLMLLRRKGIAWFFGGKGGGASRMLSDGGDGGSSGTGGAAGGRDMAERSSAAFGLPAALAGLAGKRNAGSGQNEEDGERGFYRVSGKKLPSVLTAGGDGYTDPRESVMSGTSDYYRGSQAFEPNNGALTRLALGSPMRPVSGVPVMRPGPGRTAVPEQNPFADPFSDSLPPSPPPTASADGAERSLTSQNGSAGSKSRFKERLSQ